MILTDKKKLAALGDKAQKLGELKQHPSWGLLKQIVESRKTKQFDYFTRQLMSGEAVDQRKLDFLRGWWAGVDYVIANPENAEATFEAALKKAEAYDEGDDD